MIKAKTIFAEVSSMRKILKQFPFIRDFLLSVRHRFWQVRTRRNLDVYLTANATARLQLGAGQNILQGWFNTDYFPRPEVFFLDVTKTFPVPSNSFNFIFTEHHIEHISYKDAVFMLKECCRILNPGGMIRITTPDLRNTLLNYLDDAAFKKGLLDSSERNIRSGFHNAINYIPIDGYMRAHLVNDTFLNYEHKFIYDFESMKRVLQHAGFANIKDCGQKETGHAAFQNIEAHASEVDRYFTLAVEAEKTL